MEPGREISIAIATTSSSFECVPVSRPALQQRRSGRRSAAVARSRAVLLTPSGPCLVAYHASDVAANVSRQRACERSGCERSGGVSGFRGGASGVSVGGARGRGVVGARFAFSNASRAGRCLDGEGLMSYGGSGLMRI